MKYEKYMTLFIWWMLKGSVLEFSGLYTSIFQDRSDKSTFNMFLNMFEKGLKKSKSLKICYALNCQNHKKFK